MAEKAKADIYITYLDKILAGEKDIGPVEDAEIAKLLLLAKNMLAADLSINSKMKKDLKRQLLVQIKKGSGLSALLQDEDKLGEDDLDLVAAGFTKKAGEQNNICPFCGSIKNLTGKCPFCNH